MKKVVKKELEKEILGATAKHFPYAHMDRSITCWLEKDKLVISISQMYEYVDMTFDLMEDITKIVGSRKMNIGNKSNYPGCETCDYGSKYTLELVVLEPGVTFD
jgi:hypothetical protein